MSVNIVNRFPVGGEFPADHSENMEMLENLLDLATLVAWMEESLPSVHIPCTCTSDTLCRRCEAEVIVQRHRDKQKQPLHDPVQIDPQPMNLDDLPF